MRHGSLFSGIGGFDLASEWMGWENVFQVEKDEWCRKVLNKNFPLTKRYTDIKEFKTQEYNGKIDIITGGFPCQPFSKAGRRRGKEDDRYLWPEMLRVIGSINPLFVVGENVYGIAKTELQGITTSLEDLGYITVVFDIPASAVGTLHRRSRIWIIGIKKNTLNPNSNSLGSHRTEIDKQGNSKLQYEQIGKLGQVVSESIRKGADPRIFGNINGVSNRVDRIRGIGNAVHPSIPFEIFKILSKLKT